MKERGRLTIVAGSALLITLFHYITDPHAGPIHDLLQRAYYFPVVLAGLWFGARGGLLTAALISIAYYPHALHGWSGPHTFVFRFIEMFMYHVIGGLTGVLAARVNAAYAAEKAARAEEKKAYERLRQKTEELFTLEEQLRRSDRLAALGRLSAGLAHEIRNPLASIKTSVEMLREERDEAGGGSAARAREGAEGRPDFLVVIHEETNRLNAIVTEFLEFARQEKAQPSDEPNHCRPAEVFARTVELLGLELQKRGIEATFEPDDSAQPVGLCATHLRQIFLNLMLNSIDAIDRDGKIRVRLERPSAGGDAPSSVRLLFEDDGPGIDAEAADRVFDPFYTTKDQGTGLGLSLVDRILASHGGRIVLDRTTLPSSRFQLDLPVACSERS